MADIFNKIDSTLQDIGGGYTSDIYSRNKGVINKLEAGHKRPKSIAGMAKANIFEFPAFISSSVPLDYAEATCNLLELTYASFLQMAISRAPFFNAKDGDDPFAKWKTDTNNYLECSDLTYTFDACHNEIITEDGVTFEFNLVSISDYTGEILNEQLEYEPLSEFDHYFGEASTTSYADKRKDKVAKALDELEEGGVMPKEVSEERIAHNNAVDDEYLRSTSGDDDEPILGKDALERLKLQDYLNNVEDERNRAKKKLNFETKTKAPEVLDESKIQKVNSLKPLTMVCEMRASNEGKQPYPIEIVAGVKMYARLIKAEMLPEIAKYPLEEMNKRTRYVRYKAGELKFFKDIVFRIKQKKQTAIDSKDPDRKWYRRLYELAHTTGDSASVGKLTKNKSIVRSRLRDALLKFGDPTEHEQRGFIPNATIVISKDDVNYVKAETGIDLLNNGTAVGFCSELFLMNLVVIDTDAQIIKVLTPDQHKDFEIHTLASVNKQLSMIDSASTTSREIFKALNKR